MKLPKWLGYVLWKLKIAVRIMDDIKVDGFFTDNKEMHMDYTPKKWHYELKLK